MMTTPDDRSATTEGLGRQSIASASHPFGPAIADQSAMLEDAIHDQSSVVRTALDDTAIEKTAEIPVSGHVDVLVDEILVGLHKAHHSTPTIRLATAADIADFYGDKPPRQSMRARVAVLDGKVIGIAGLIYPEVGTPYLFSEMKPEMKRFPKVIVRESRRFLASLNGVRACAGASTESAARFLTRLGFTPAGEHNGQRIFVFEGNPANV